jgi:hypothetical protein
MQHNKFYGTEKISSISYLEFGAIDLDSSKKLVWDLKLHQKAYDWYMHARYSNDILCYMIMSEQLGKLSLEEIIAMYCKEVHHKDDFSVTIGKLAALKVAQNRMGSGEPLSFFELGQTLFGCIDAMQFCQSLMSHSGIAHEPVNLHEVQWHGVDISDFFNRFSALMHSAFQVHTADEIKSLKGVKDVFFAKGVTLLYAIRTMEQLLEMLDSAKICIFDYSFATHEEHEVIIGSGKVVKYLWLGDFVQKLKDLPGQVYVKQGNSFLDRQNKRLTLDCVYAEEQYCREFIAIDRSMRDSFAGISGQAEGAEILLDTINSRNSGWMTLDSFLAEHGLAPESAQHGN